MAEVLRAGGHGVEARRLIRRTGHAALATSLGGRPFASLVAVSAAFDATPLMLLSDLAQHTRNLAAQPLVSLLFAPPGENPDPLAAPRLSLLARAERSDDPPLLERFVARHPASAGYAGFGDFHLYRAAIERGHLVAGFGRIEWVAEDELRFAADAAALAAAEREIIARLNAEDAAALALCAERLLRRPGDDWVATGIDPEGIDLRRNGETERLDFVQPATNPAAAFAAFADLAAQAAGS